MVVVAVVAVAAVAVFGRRDHQTQAPEHAAAEAGPAATAYSQAASTAAFAPIADRGSDRKPLTAADVVDTKTITDADSKAAVKLTASKLDRRCAVAVWGSALARELQRGGCTQAARGVYADKTYAAMVTIFNLADVKSADRLVATIEPGSANGFPLVPSGATTLGRGFSIARGVAMGHYAVISWVGRADGTGDEQDPKLLSLLVATGRPKAVLVRAAGRPAAG